MILLNAYNLEKSFAARTLFQGLSFGLESGEKVGLVGPNGVGKSTLFRILSGELSPDKGELNYSKGLVVGFLEQDPRFQDGATVLEALLEKAEDKTESMGRAFELMSQLELDQFGEDFKVDALSGGWKKRLALARELILSPHLLLLDEPTNHLDVAGILWLENFLVSQKFALLMITHDRLFLQRVCARILDLDPRNPHFLLDVRGSYLEFSESKELILVSQKRREDVLKNQFRREKEWLSRGPQARQTKQKARIKDAYALEDEVDELQRKNQKLTSEIEFGESRRLPKKLIFAEGLGKSFDTKNLFQNLNLLIGPKTRLGLIGGNGSGKTTLIRCLLGLESPTSGRVDTAENLKVSYFEQSKETLDLNKTVLRNICPEGDYVSFQGDFVHVRSYLERFLFFGHHAGLVSSKLSGGERARLRLAQLMLTEAQVLVLDEPTNDLDSDTLNVLEDALKDFHGGVILVTHDRYFMDSVCDQLLALPEGLRFADYFQWEAWFKENRKEKKTKPAENKNSSDAKKNFGRMSFKDKYELENMEQTIARLEEALAQAESALKYEDMAKLQGEIDLKFKRWAELEEISKNS